MSLHRRNAKRDANEKEIVDFLRSAGVSVHLLSAKGVPDLLLGFKGKTYLAEVKTGNRKLNKNQVEFFDEWKGAEPEVFYDVGDAEAWYYELAKERYNHD